MTAIGMVFDPADVDFAQLQKQYGQSYEGTRGSAERRYSPAVCVGATKVPISGNPDPKHISTSFAERNNLNVRMHSRWMTRLTNAFSKKIENHATAKRRRITPSANPPYPLRMVPLPRLRGIITLTEREVCGSMRA
jgi:hypothetical protein